MLEVGTKAPDFELFDQDRKLHKLNDYIGKNGYFIFLSKGYYTGMYKASMWIF